MALNAASHNPTGTPTGSVTGPPPPPASETTAALKTAAENDPLKENTAGKDAGSAIGKGENGAANKPKTAKEIEKERKKAEKEQKFLEKKAKQEALAQATASNQSKKKEKKVKTHATTEAYDPKVIESGRYEWWESNGFFKPELTPKGKGKANGTFVIPIPPPNVTGALHMGHALTNALQDTMIRRARMQGKTTLWVPGCDHAGISTQSVVEKMLWRTQHKTRHDYGREKLVNIIWDWKEHYHSNITNQLKRLGGSMDWSREAYTMDSNFSAAVAETFVTLHDEGIIYRANRLVNWCTALSTSLSNLEVDNVELEKRTFMSVPGYTQQIEFGVLTHFCYEMEDGKKIEVATTRPETMLGDTGIAVHPDDKRYTEFVGQKAKHPFIEGRSLIVITDEHVDMDFGTGAVKITPAHDPNDFNLGKKHNLPFINILNDDGTFNENAGPYKGMKRFDARQKIIDVLKEKGLYVKWEHNKMKVPMCQKSKDIIEPLMKAQWWMRMAPLAKPALEVVRNGTIKIRPESAEKNFYMWLETIQDWCLSRQLWWGHRAPAYFVQIDGEIGDEADGDLWVCAHSQEEARQKASKKFPGKSFKLKWDEDVLDTWFSSGQWPFATLGWPKKTQDLENFYPTSLLETGWDILFFWVARMIMLGLKMTGKIPFSEVYCHSLIRDSEGRKMSKSLGNVVDPLDIINGIELEALHAKLLKGNLDPKELVRAKDYQNSAFPKGIGECGTDALRFALVNYTTGGGDISFDIRVIEAYRKFCNKILQATNFALKRLDDDFKPSASPSKSQPSSLAETWILHRLNFAAQAVNDAIENREFADSTRALNKYWVTELCDTFIENSKFIIQPGVPEEEQESAKQTLYTALEGGLLLLHPIMPYVTEHLWQKLPRREGDKTPSIMVASYPQYQEVFDAPKAAANYEFVMALSQGIRSLLSVYEFKEPGDVHIQTYNEDSFKTTSSELTSIKSLGGKFVGNVEVLAPDNKTVPKGCAVTPVSADAAVYLRVAGRVDLSKEKEKAAVKLTGAKEKVSKSEGIMSAKGWVKVSPDVKDKEEEKLKDAESEVVRYEEVIRELDRLALES